MKAPSGPMPQVWAGAIAAPLAWFTQQVLMGSLVYQQCHGRPWLVPVIWAVFGVLVLAAMVVSWLGLRRLPAADEGPSFAERRARMVGVLGVAMPMLFLLVMTWQGVAGLVYSGCER